MIASESTTVRRYPATWPSYFGDFDSNPKHTFDVDGSCQTLLVTPGPGDHGSSRSMPWRVLYPFDTKIFLPIGRSEETESRPA